MNQDKATERLAGVKYAEHLKVSHGYCVVCGHYGDSCTGAKQSKEMEPLTIRRTSTRPTELYDVVPASWPKDATGVGAYVTSVYVYPSKENARVLAAAAELLAALRSILSHQDSCTCAAALHHPTWHASDCIFSVAQVAIRKATGEGGL